MDRLDVKIKPAISGYWIVYPDGTESKIPLGELKPGEVLELEKFLNEVWWNGKEN